LDQRALALASHLQTATTLDPATFAQPSAHLAFAALFGFLRLGHWPAQTPTVVAPLVGHQTLVAVQLMASQTRPGHWPARQVRKLTQQVAQMLAMVRMLAPRLAVPAVRTLVVTHQTAADARALVMRFAKNAQPATLPATALQTATVQAQPWSMR